MRLVLAGSVFERISVVESSLLLWIGGTGRHRILVEDDSHPSYIEWRDRLTPELQEEWALMLAKSLTEDAVHPSFHEVRVEHRPQSSWGTLTLNVRTALDLLERPYRILLENGFSDRRFLLSSYARRDREWLEGRISAEWVEIEHCGGKEDLRKLVAEVKRDPSRRLRTSALFDGDGLRPKKPGNQSIADACYPDVHHHMLRRRAIENYLPRASLERWAKRSDGRQEEVRLAKVRALFDGLSHDQRAHYNVKAGLAGDERRHDRAPELYADISAESRRLLEEGFGDDIAALYGERWLKDDDFDRAARDELQPFIQDLLARIR